MNYQQRMMFLATVEEVVNSDPSLLVDIIEATNRGVQKKLAEVNNQRAEAETALVMAYDMIPASKLTKGLAATRIRKVIVNSGFVGGSDFAKQLQKELSSEQA